MIEIILIWRLAVGIGNQAAQKGLKKIPYQIMAILLWICGEVTGALLGSILLINSDSTALTYILALVGAVCGAGMAFLVMRLIPASAVVAVSPVAIVTQDISVTQIFGRTVWLPILVILVAVSC